MLLTILTPTYNRSNLLKRCYNSLKEQTNKNFEWLVIDDGSTDDTKTIIEGFIEEDILPIRYIYKENGGKHTALNVGFKKAKGELTIIVDSDDSLTFDAVETIDNLWKQYRENKEISSIVFLRKYSNGKIIGDKFPQDNFISNHIECRINLGIDGDKSEVYVTKILNKYQFPVFEGEKFLSEGIIWTQIGRAYKAVYINKPIYVTEYLNDGLTKSGRGLRIKCPLGGMLNSKDYLQKDIRLNVRIKQMILYQCYGLFAKKNLHEMINSCGCKILFILCTPCGYLLYKYWKFKYGNLN